MEKWVKFLREFELLRDRVEDRTPSEEVRLLYANLPQKWQKLLLKEEVRRKKGKYLVRLTGTPPKAPSILQAELQRLLQVHIDKVTPSFNGVIVTTSSVEAQKALLGLHGYTVGGVRITTSKVDSTMTGAELCDHITESLMVEEKFAVLRKTLQLPGDLPIKEVEEIIPQGRTAEHDRQPGSPSGGGKKGKGKGKSFPKGSSDSESPSSPSKGKSKGRDSFRDRSSSPNRQKGKDSGGKSGQNRPTSPDRRGQPNDGRAQGSSSQHQGGGGKGDKPYCPICHAAWRNAHHWPGECRVAARERRKGKGPSPKGGSAPPLVLGDDKGARSVSPRGSSQ